MDQKALVFDIQRFSYHDGPGIRTVVFLKGCNLRCFWCQNPESQSAVPEIMFCPQKCIGCGKCVEACPNGCHGVTREGVRVFRREACIGCGRCAAVCASEALQLVGRSMSVDEVAETVLRDIPFYRLSGGGVTISGGEPLLQDAWCRALLKCCREEGVSTAVETAGNVPWKNLERILPVTDYVMYDVKVLDALMHREWCGSTNLRVLENLRLLRNTSVNLIIRIPVIPGVNDTSEFVAEVGNMVDGYPNLMGIELLPFNKLGKAKYTALGREYEAERLAELPSRKMQELRRFLGSRGVVHNDGRDPG
ncbi:MAG: glycyl-radical enzyme activating protein [Bacillota bacterium]|nr:glycyl-radical enzyme activating protein [Bacillota bacterium]